MSGSYEFDFSTRVAAPPEEVWAHATSMRDVNRELFPLARTFIEFEPGRRFLERSPMLTQCEWQHERVVEPVAGGSTITDRVQFVPRAAWLGPVFLAVFRLAFALRHQNLRRIFGGMESP